MLSFHSVLDAKGKVRCARRGRGTLVQEAGLRPLWQQEHSAGSLPEPGQARAGAHSTKPSQGWGHKACTPQTPGCYWGGGLGLCSSVGMVGRFLRAVKGWEIQENLQVHSRNKFLAVQPTE